MFSVDVFDICISSDRQALNRAAVMFVRATEVFNLTDDKAASARDRPKAVRREVLSQHEGRVANTNASNPQRNGKNFGSCVNMLGLSNKME